MSPLETIIIVAVGFLVMLLLGQPLTFTLGGLAVIFGYFFWGHPSILNLFVRTAFNLTTSIAYVSVPLFIYMGAVLERSEAANDLFESLYVIFGQVRGGLAIATVIICTMLAAATGIIGAGITLMTMLALPAMQERKYDPQLSTGSIMAAGCLGTIIPPSIILVIYGAQAQISIGKLFAGGIGAGLVLSVLYIIYIALRAFLNPKMAPAIRVEEASKYSTREKLYMVVRSVLPTLGLIFAVLGSILLGMATPTEAAALGCIGALIIAALNRKLTWELVRDSCFATLKTTSMILWIILAASMFTSVFLGLGGGELLSAFVEGLALNRWIILSLILFIILIMGMFIDSYGVLLIGIPVFTPVVYGLGFDPIWFAIIFAVMIQASYLSPPFAYAVFYVKGIAPKAATINQLYRAAIPFLLLQVLAVVILSVFPDIITWLPSRMM